jgi:hypothetical protein
MQRHPLYDEARREAEARMWRYLRNGLEGE